MVQKRPRQHKEGKVLQIKKKRKLWRVILTPVQLTISIGSGVDLSKIRGTKREAEKTTTQKDTEGPQVCTYCENHSQLMWCVTRDSFTSVLNRSKVSIFLCDYAANRSIF